MHAVNRFKTWWNERRWEYGVYRSNRKTYGVIESLRRLPRFKRYFVTPTDHELSPMEKSKTELEYALRHAFEMVEEPKPERLTHPPFKFTIGQPVTVEIYRERGEHEGWYVISREYSYWSKRITYYVAHPLGGMVNVYEEDLRAVS
jgi:hypothetical protein